MTFDPGDEVVVIEGEFKGYFGIVSGYEQMFEVYRVQLPEVSDKGDFGFSEAQIALLEEPEEVEQDIPAFGLSASELAGFMSEFLESSVDRVLTVGDMKYGRDGYQEFESADWEAILEKLQDDARNVAGWAAILYLLIGRMKNAAMKGS